MPKRKEAQSYGEMLDTAESQKKQSKLYRAQSAEFVDERLSSLIAKTAAELAEIADKEPVSLTDTQRVKERTMVYLRACEESSCIPSISGLAVSMGLSRQAVYDCIWRQSPKATAEWLELCRDTFSNVLAESSLRNDCNPVVSIFLQKAIYGLKETITIEAKQETPLGPILEADELQKRIEANCLVED